jgi:enolase
MLELDGTFNKSVLGANAILGISLACARCAATCLNIPLYRYIGGMRATILPTPMMNILNGGVHATNNLDIQEFMIAPVGVSSFSQAIKAGVEIFHAFKSILEERGLSTNVGDEGGFAPNLSSPEEGIELIINAIEKAGYNTKIIKICLDIAATEFYEEGECSGGMCSLSNYVLKNKSCHFSSEEMIDYLSNLVENYPIISIEDGLAEDDELGWRKLTQKLGNKCQLVGDDLFTTNVNRLFDGIKKKLGNSILIKPNQIGTLSETMDTILMAQKNNYSTIISHRSGDTEDTFIADLAVGVNAGLIKTGSLSRTERICKYNRLLKIEQELGGAARYMGIHAFNPLASTSSL